MFNLSITINISLLCSILLSTPQENTEKIHYYTLPLLFIIFSPLFKTSSINPRIYMKSWGNQGRIELHGITVNI